MEVPHRSIAPPCRHSGGNKYYSLKYLSMRGRYQTLDKHLNAYTFIRNRLYICLQIQPTYTIVSFSKGFLK